MFNALGKIGEIKEKIAAARIEIAALQFTGEAFDGSVVAHVNGARQLLKVEVADSLLNSESKTILQDFVVVAVNSAQLKADEAAKQIIAKTLKESGFDFPGLDLNALLGA
jgi:DNA-binding protein YbaB